MYPESPCLPSGGLQDQGSIGAGKDLHRCGSIERNIFCNLKIKGIFSSCRYHTGTANSVFGLFTNLSGLGHNEQVENS
jgi:hypothetical protein